MTFRVGQKVVCIASRKGVINDLGLPGFVKGRVYTVAEIYEEPPHGMFLTTIESGPRLGGQFCGFRPVAERKTDISIFAKMLTGKRVDA